MTAKFKGIILVIIATLLTSLGQIFWKFGSYYVTGDIFSWLIPPIILGFASYGLAAFFLIIALKHGELSTLYPIVATSYVWVALLSPLFFSDSFSVIKFIGIGIIILGITVLTRGEKND